MSDLHQSLTRSGKQSNQITFFCLRLTDKLAPGDSSRPMLGGGGGGKIDLFGRFDAVPPFDTRNIVDDILKTGDRIEQFIRQIEVAVISVWVSRKGRHQTCDSLWLQVIKTSLLKSLADK